MRRRDLPLAILGFMVAFVLGIALATAWKANAAPEVEYTDRVTTAYPEMSRLDALMTGWMVCDVLDDGWTPQQAAEWLAGEPADFYGIDDDPAVFGQFLVESAAPMCP